MLALAGRASGEDAARRIRHRQARSAAWRHETQACSAERNAGRQAARRKACFVASSSPPLIGKQLPAHRRVWQLASTTMEQRTWGAASGGLSDCPRDLSNGLAGRPWRDRGPHAQPSQSLPAPSRRTHTSFPIHRHREVLSLFKKKSSFERRAFLRARRRKARGAKQRC